VHVVVTILNVGHGCHTLLSNNLYGAQVAKVDVHARNPNPCLLSQIDTWNRNMSYGQPFVPGPESTASQAPVTGPDAVYR
jgi:hypothetical protein